MTPEVGVKYSIKKSKKKLKMAAIISQMAANKRARLKNNKRIIPAEKCVYFLPPFDERFDPTVHNKYIKAIPVPNI